MSGVWAKAAGAWEQVYPPLPPAPAWNAATGGTVVDIPNYNGTGKLWRVHTFTANSEFVVTKNPNPFRVLVVGGGGGGGPSGGGAPHGGGGSGSVGTDSDVTIPLGTHPVTIGGGGSGAAYGWESGGLGGTSSLGSLVSAAGGAGGAHNGAPGVTGGPVSNIADGQTDVQYGPAGGVGTQCNKNCNGSPGSSSGAAPANSGGGGGGERAEGSCCGSAGGAAGVVIVAYEIETPIPVYNDATGGVVLDVANYNGTGQTWRLHAIRSSGTFTVTKSVEPFDIWLVGGGANGCADAQGSNGGGGATVILRGHTLPVGDYPLTVGPATPVVQSGCNGKVDGNPTTGFGQTAAGGTGSSHGANSQTDVVLGQLAARPSSSWDFGHAVAPDAALGSDVLMDTGYASWRDTVRGVGGGGGQGGTPGGWGYGGTPGGVLVAYRIA